MPTVTLNEFGRGVDVSRDATRIAVGAAVTAENVRVGTNTVSAREGRVVHDALPGVGAGRALAQWHDGSASPSCRLLAAVGQKLYATDETNQTFSGSVSAIVADLHATNRPRFAQFDVAGDPWVYWVDGSASVRRWRPGQSVVTLTDLQRPSHQADVSVGQLNGSMFQANATRDGSANIGLSAPDASWQLNAWNAWTYGALDNAEVLGVCTRKIDDPAWQDTDRSKSASVALEFVATSDLVEWLTCGGYMVYGVRAASVVTKGATSGYDLSEATSINIRLRLVADARFSTAYPSNARLYFGSTYTLGATALDNYVSLDLTGINLNEWTTITADISGIAGNDKDNVRYFMLRFDNMECKPTAYANVPQSSNRAFGSGKPSVLVMVSDIWANVDNSEFSSGTYEFTYSYVWNATDANEEEGPVAFDATDLKSPYTSVVVDAALSTGLTISCAADAATGVTYDGLNIYARGGISADWRQIAQITAVAPSNTYAFTWDGAYPADADILNPYVEKAPAGCSALYAHGGRMFYAKGARLFISNDSDADRVPQSALLRMSATDGGWVDVGQDGADITGMCALGSYLVVAKSRGVWMLSGEDASSFALFRIDAGTGCTSHESMAVVNGKLVWLDPDGRVMTWDGNNAPVEIGAEIRTLVAAHSVSARNAAFAVVDPTCYAYHLCVPATATATTTPASTWYTLDTRTNGWTVATGMPGGAAVFSEQATARNVYALDRYVGTVSPASIPALYRVNTGTSDCAIAGTGTAIAGAWKSGRIVALKPRREHDVERVTVRFSDDTVLSSCTLSLYANGKSTASAAKTVTVHQTTNAGVYAEWECPLIPNVRDVAIGVSWSATTKVEVLDVTVDVADLGEVVL